jgi:hypothetical protein
MTGYTHTCASCEAKLKIHERYVGRALHCPQCGTEFLADPALADVDDIIEEMAGGRERSIPWMPILAAVVLFAAAALVLGQASHGGLLAEFFKPVRTSGQFATLALDGRTAVPAAMDRESVVFVVAALEDGDPGSLQALSAQGKIIEMSVGTKVKVIEHVRRDRAARVRVLDGQWTGRVVWVPMMAVK